MLKYYVYTSNDISTLETPPKCIFYANKRKLQLFQEVITNQFNPCATFMGNRRPCNLGCVWLFFHEKCPFPPKFPVLGCVIEFFFHEKYFIKVGHSDYVFLKTKENIFFMDAKFLFSRQFTLSKNSNYGKVQHVFKPIKYI